MIRFVTFLVISVTVFGVHGSQDSAADVLSDIYQTCLSSFSLKCAKPKALSWISRVSGDDEIKLTNKISIVKTSEPEVDRDSFESRSDNTLNILNKVDSFLATHALKMGVPELLETEEAKAYIPESYLKGGLAEGVVVPLSTGNVQEGES